MSPNRVLRGNAQSSAQLDKVGEQVERRNLRRRGEICSLREIRENSASGAEWDGMGSLKEKSESVDLTSFCPPPPLHLLFAHSPLESGRPATGRPADRPVKGRKRDGRVKGMKTATRVKRLDRTSLSPSSSSSSPSSGKSLKSRSLPG